MSVEAPISTIGAIAPATGMGIESAAAISTPSFTGNVDGMLSSINNPMQSIDVGGVNSPELNSNIFSMQEMKVDGIENFDKVVPGDLAFTKTEVLWQAPPADLVSQEEIKQEVKPELLSEPVLILDSYVSSDLENKLVSDENTVPEIVNKAPIQSTITFQEIKADEIQAEKVMDALIAIGIPQEKAEESAMIVLEETLKKKGITDNLTQENIEALVELKTENEPVLNEEIKTQTTLVTDDESEIQTQKIVLPKPKENFLKEILMQIMLGKNLQKKRLP